MPDSPVSGRPLPSSFDNDEVYQETGAQKVVRRLKEEPLIPIGTILTIAAFTNAYRAMRRGDHHGVQRMFRARVAAQAFTIAAMVAGGYYYKEDRQKLKELWMLEQKQKAEEKRLKWIKELEARDEEDKALKQRLEKRKQRLTERTGGTGTEAIALQARALKDAKKDETKDETKGEADHKSNQEKQPNGRVLGSLGGLFGTSKKAPEQTTPDSDDARKKE
ncbi:hypoxia induced protein conserved region-domain-containing protein [Cladorrhinum sp. PSN259]|nr:hypoxia induced protein conserved region-domain-containing protein [Cladorrhinum sp. PSN259]